MQKEKGEGEVKPFIDYSEMPHVKNAAQIEKTLKEDRNNNISISNIRFWPSNGPLSI